MFSETKLSVVPAYCFHIPSPEDCTAVPLPPQPAAPRSEAPARPAPDMRKKSRLESARPEPIHTPVIAMRPAFPWRAASS